MAPLQTHYPLWSTIRLHPDTPPIELKPPIRHIDETHWSALWVYNPIWIFTSKLSRPIQIHIRTIMILKMNSSKKSQPFFLLQTSNEFQHHHGMYLLCVAFFNELCIFALLNKFFFFRFCFLQYRVPYSILQLTPIIFSWLCAVNWFT